jgi:hypothetical protein
LKISKFGVLGLGVVAALGVTAPGFAGGNKYDSVADSRDCDNGRHVDWVGAIKLWPPNHKFQSSTVTAVGSDTDMVSISVRPVVTDAVGGDGGAQHDPDYVPGANTGPAMGSASQDLSLRSERSGKGDGRTYTIHWTAMYGAEKCTSEDGSHAPFVVEVPHDMRDK